MTVRGAALPSRNDPLVYIEHLDVPELDAADERHLRASLRLRAGSAITLSDGDGGFRPAVLVGDAGVAATGETVTVPPPTSPLTIAFTPVKAVKPEWLVAKLTEIGADIIVPLQTERSVVRWDGAKAAKLSGRFVTAAREAGMQSRRARLPEIRPLATVAAIRSQGAVLAEPGSRRPTAADRFIAIGPEGGWAPAELDGADTVVLPGEILRAETAVLVAAGVAVGLGSGVLASAIADSGTPK